MTTYSSTFSAAGQVSSPLVIPKGKTLQYSLSATWGTGSVVLEKKVGANGWKVVSDVHAANRSLSSPSDLGEGTYRLRCLTYQNTITYVLGDVVDMIKEYQNEAGQTVFKITDEGIETLKISGAEKIKTQFLHAAVNSKVGATAGWVVSAANNIALATLPAGVTAGTLVIPVRGLNVGDIINSFYAVGQVESAGNTASITVELRKMTAAAADVSDATVDTTGAVSFTADAIMSSANVAKTLTAAETVGADESFYFLVSGTTAASTDIALQGIGINVTKI
jgi:hypothetical protein